MTSRAVPTEPSGTSTSPGARPHLPPVEPGGTSRRTDRKAPLAWLPWLLLGLLLLTLLAVALLARAADGSGSGSTDETAGSAAQSQSQSGGGSESAAQPQGGGDAGSLTADGQDLLALPTGQLAALEGTPVTGSATVESVVADEGFWVGSGPDARVFVHLSPEARRSMGESGFQVEAGQAVQVEGSVARSTPEFVQQVGVTEAEGSAQLVEQRGYVEATQIRLSE